MASLTLVAGAVDLGCDGATDASDDPASHNAAKTTATNRLIGFFTAAGSLDSPFAQGLAYPFCFRQLELPVIALDKAVNYDSPSLDRYVNNQDDGGRR